MFEIMEIFNVTYISNNHELNQNEDVSKIVGDCWKGYQDGEFDECYDYCNYYSVNSVSPVIEGYTKYFNYTIE